MNIHHLELFYYVARHGGIGAAVRNIPYGIQQPAVSGQVAKLEENLGVKLFERRPFSLSPAGAELYAFIEPFFANLDAAANKIRRNSAPQLRIAAPAIALHDYVPVLLQRVRGKFREFQLRLHEASQPEAEKLVRSGEVDIAITLVEKKSRGGTNAKALLELPLVLLVPKKHPLKDAEALWRSDKIEETLICLPPADAVSMRFQEELERRDLVWNCGIEVNSLSLIECYVANGYGLGLSVVVPGSPPPKTVRALPLRGFASVTVGAIWARNLSPIAELFLAELEVEAAGHRA